MTCLDLFSDRKVNNYLITKSFIKQTIIVYMYVWSPGLKIFVVIFQPPYRAFNAKQLNFYSFSHNKFNSILFYLLYKVKLLGYWTLKYLLRHLYEKCFFFSKMKALYEFLQSLFHTRKGTIIHLRAILLNE